MKVREMLSEVLAPLCHTRNPEAVAVVLREAGACGKQGCAEICAVANYLRERVKMHGVTGPVTVDVRPTGFDPNVVNVEFCIGSQTYKYQLPGAVGDFVDAFDNGEYPELDIESEESE